VIQRSPAAAAVHRASVAICGITIQVCQCPFEPGFDAEAGHNA